MIADKSYAADEFRQAIKAGGAEPVIPTHANRKMRTAYNKRLYGECHLIEYGKHHVITKRRQLIGNSRHQTHVPISSRTILEYQILPGEVLDVKPTYAPVLADEPAKFTTYVFDLSCDLALRQWLATNARRLVEPRYDWSCTDQRFFELVGEVASREECRGACR